MIEHLERLEKAPNSLLDNVTKVPDELKSADKVAPENTTPLSDTSGGATMQDILQGNEHTKITPLLGGETANAATSGANGLPGGSSVQLGGLVGAKTAIELMDSLLPGLLVASLYSLSVKLRKSELQLTQAEKDTIAPIMKQCLDTIDLNFNNPWHCLMFTVGIIYGSKVAEKGVIKWIDNMNEKRDEKELAKIVEMKAAATAPKEAAKPVSQPAQKEDKEKPPFSENQIAAEMKRRKIGRERAIASLKKKHGI